MADDFQNLATTFRILSTPMVTSLIEQQQALEQQHLADLVAFCGPWNLNISNLTP
jgi:hypothetical protein